MEHHPSHASAATRSHASASSRPSGVCSNALMISHCRRHFFSKAWSSGVRHPNLDWSQPCCTHLVAAALYTFGAWLHALHHRRVQSMHFYLEARRPAPRWNRRHQAGLRRDGLE